MSRKAERETELKYLERVTKKPVIKPRVGKVSASERIITEFEASGLSHAIIRQDVIEKEFQTKNILIGLLRYVSQHPELKEKYEIGKTADGKIAIIKKE